MCFVVGKNVCKMIPNSSFCFLCCTVLVVYVLVCISIFILYCSECAMRRLRLGYLCCCILCVHDVVFLLNPVWPTYELLHVLYFSLYMRLEFYFIEWYSIAELVDMVLLVRKDIFKSVFFNKLVTLCMRCLRQVKATDFLFCCVCMGMTFVF